ncbi:MAG: adenylosuccinate synthetase [Lewinellaceae bacterium]|nr:adenylosuccinate synthetase [Lewinellaceae bacterium]
MKTKIVIGLGFGDEGKGLATDYLCRQNRRPLVIRFSGGHQAGHTVVLEDGRRHVFSSFGSGTLRGAPTYWSRFCTFYPIGFFNEWKALAALGMKPRIYVDALAPVTTPYEVYYNRALETVNAHGSCGLGFGATIERNESPYKLFVQDLFYPAVLEQKLGAIRQYYEQKSRTPPDDAIDGHIGFFKQVVQDILPLFELVQEKAFFRRLQADTLIFEGSQGVLLDMDHGFFPHVTRACTGPRNALELIRDNGLPEPDIYYISRAYLTRHGNGPLPNEGQPANVRSNPLETNQYNPWQGQLRKAPLDIDMLQYALSSCRNYYAGLREHLALTCLDQVEGPLQAVEAGVLRTYGHPAALAKAIGFPFHSLLESYSDRSAGMVETVWGVRQGVEG